MRAWLNLRHSVPERRAAFEAGFRRLGFDVVHGSTISPADCDVLLTWNRIHVGNIAAQAFEARGLPVLVVENSSWGNDFAGCRWLTLARGNHNTADRFPVGGDDRWDRLGVDPAPWRDRGETVILAQRSIGAPPVAMPRGWPERMRNALGARVRVHPGQSAAMPLEQDLARAGTVVTWGSGAAIKALLWGIPVESHMPGWIGEQDNTDAGRLAMLRRLAWAQWQLPEIASGEPMRRLLQ